MPLLACWHHKCLNKYQTIWEIACSFNSMQIQHKFNNIRKNWEKISLNFARKLQKSREGRKKTWRKWQRVNSTSHENQLNLITQFILHHFTISIQLGQGIVRELWGKLLEIVTSCWEILADDKWSYLFIFILCCFCWS